MDGIRQLRLKKIWARWRELALGMTLAIAIVLIELFTFRRLLLQMAEVPLWAVGTGTAALFAICTQQGRGRWLAFFGLRHLVTYPPLWLASITGSSVVLLIIGKVPAVSDSLALSAEDSVPLVRLGMAGLVGTFLLLASATSVSLVLAWRRRRLPRQLPSVANDTTTASQALHGSLTQFQAWLANDKPIASRDDDAFGYDRIAQRIAGRLVAVGTPPAQAIVGRLGAGKSSLRRLVEDALKNRSSQSGGVRMVPVELWPYETPRAAVEGVIGELVNALAKDVGVVAVLGLPRSYVQAMSSLGGAWAVLGHLQGSATNPFEALKRKRR